MIFLELYKLGRAEQNQKSENINMLKSKQMQINYKAY